MSTFFTADLHLFHRNILDYCSRTRPFENIDKMHDAIKDGWNRYVGKHDEVWILGDLTLLGSEHLQKVGNVVQQLNGKKHFVMGNHDRMRPEHYKDIGFETVHYPYVTSDYPHCNLAHDPAVASNMVWNPVLLCGHVHDLWKEMKTERGHTIINVGLDARDFEPVRDEDIYKIIEMNTLKK